MVHNFYAGLEIKQKVFFSYPPSPNKKTQIVNVLLAFIVLYGHKNPKLFIAFYTHTLVAYSSAVVAHTFIVGS